MGLENVSYGIKYTLVFGSEEENITITSACPVEFKELAAAIKKSLRTIRYDAGKTIDPKETFDFTIDVSASGLKPGQSMGLCMLFTADGHIPTLSADKDLMVATRSFKEQHFIDKNLFALKR